MIRSPRPDLGDSSGDNLEQKMETNSCLIRYSFKVKTFPNLMGYFSSALSCGGSFVMSQDGANTAFAYGS
jgi:hypothetical protein